MNTPVKHIVLHQSGKVGSSTLLASLTAARPDLTIVKTHFLSSYYTDYFQTIMGHSACPADLRHVLQQQLALSRRARALLDNSPAEQCCVMGGVRDPLSYAISAFFQNVAFFAPDLSFDPEHHESEVARLHDRFHQLFAYCGGECPAEPIPLFARWVLGGASVNWYADDYCPTYGIDLQALPPVQADAVSFRHAGRLHVVYRFETFPTCLSAIFSEFGLPAADSLRRNVSAEKAYARLYEAFRRRFRPTAAMWDFYYNGPFFRQFFPGATPAFASPTGDSISQGVPTPSLFPLRLQSDRRTVGCRPSIASFDEDELEVAQRERRCAERQVGELEQALEEARRQLRQTERRLERTQLRLKQARHTLDAAEGRLPWKQLLRQTELRLTRAEERTQEAEQRRDQSERDRQVAEDRLMDQCLRNTRSEAALDDLHEITRCLKTSVTYRWLARIFPRVRAWTEAVRNACAGTRQTGQPATAEEPEVDQTAADDTDQQDLSVLPFTKPTDGEKTTRRMAA